MTDPKFYRKKQLAALTDRIGVYALCDLDEVPIYVGQSVDGIRTRVQRHLTSARSDIIANRQIDVWEIAFVWAWPVDELSQIGPLEAHLFVEFDSKKNPHERQKHGSGEPTFVFGTAPAVGSSY